MPAALVSVLGCVEQVTKKQTAGEEVEVMAGRATLIASSRCGKQKSTSLSLELQSDGISWVPGRGLWGII